MRARGGKRLAISLAAATSLAFATFAAKLLIACVDLDSLGNGRPDAIAPSTGDGDSDIDGSSGAVDRCTHDRPALSSDVDDAEGVELPPFFLALDEVAINPDEVAGFDLDGVCTCDSRPGALADGGGSCLSPTPTTTGATVCDLDGGADNLMAVIAKEGVSDVRIDKLPNRILKQGRRGLLLRIAKYNGLANDKKVVVGAIVAEGIRDQGCDASTLQTDTNTWSPGGCGNDTWTVNANSVVGTQPLVVGNDGYVRDFRLVVRLGSAAKLPFTEETLLSVESPIVTGTLVPLDVNLAPRDAAAAPTGEEQRFFRLENAVLAGRVSSGETLTAIGSYRPGGGPRLCTVPGIFDEVQRRICERLDVIRNGTNDPRVPCNALSFAMGFVAIPALAGALAEAGAPFTACDLPDGAPLDCR